MENLDLIECDFAFSCHAFKDMGPYCAGIHLTGEHSPDNTILREAVEEQLCEILLGGDSVSLQGLPGDKSGQQ